MAEDPFVAYNTLQLGNQTSQAVTNLLLGPSFAGWIVHFMLFGIAVSSCWEYLGSASSSKDTRRTKALVAIVMLSELLCVAISFEQCVHYGIAQDRSLPTLLFFQPIDAAPSAASGTTAVIVQLYLARRAAQLFINRPVAQRIFRVTASVLAILAWLAAISVSVLYALVVGGHATFNGVDAIYTTNIMFGTWMWLSVSVDWMIAVTLAMVLSKHVSGFSSATDNLLRRIIALSIRTAAFPALFATAGACLAVSFPRDSIPTSNIFFAFVFPLPSLYTLSFLSTLRAREGNSARFELDKDRSLSAALNPISESDGDEYQENASLPPLSKKRAAPKVASTSSASTSNAAIFGSAPHTELSLNLKTHQELVAIILEAQQEAASKKAALDAREAAEAARKVAAAKASMPSTISKTMVWRPSCKQGTAKWSHDLHIPRAAFHDLFGLPKTFKKMGKLSLDEFRKACGGHLPTGQVRYDTLGIMGDTVSIRYMDDMNMGTVSGTYGKGGSVY